MTLVCATSAVVSWFPAFTPMSESSFATIEISEGSDTTRESVSASGIQRFASLKFFDATIAWTALTILPASFLSSGEAPFFFAGLRERLEHRLGGPRELRAAMASCASAIHQAAAP